MKRILLICLTFLTFAATGLLAVTPANSQQPIPTNTRRAPSTMIPTNTPRSNATSTPTVRPTRTTVPTRTPIPSRTPFPTRTPTLTPTITPTTIGPILYPDNINPLTGQPYPSEEARNRRNLIVKVSNFPEVVRPQSGLSKADIVYEYEVEGGVTRFAAIYRSEGSEHVGSVRSGRLLDLELIVMYQALFAYSGTNDKIKAMIGAAEWKYQVMTPQFGDNCPPFCRFPRPGVPFEHTLFGNTFEMWNLATRRNVNQGFPARGFMFDQIPPANGKPVNDIAIKWFGRQDARWQYNSQDGKYYRWNNGIPHIDIETGQQLSADNIIVVEAEHIDRPDIYESESGATTLEIQLWGSQRAWVFRDGYWYSGIWERLNREKGALQIKTSNGRQSIALKPGKSWIEVVRCCNMNGVKTSEIPVDTAATATFAVQTATAFAPPGLAATLTAVGPQPGTPLPPTATLKPGEATPTPRSVGMNPTTP